MISTSGVSGILQQKGQGVHCAGMWQLPVGHSQIAHLGLVWPLHCDVTEVTAQQSSTQYHVSQLEDGLQHRDANFRHPTSKTLRRDRGMMMELPLGLGTSDVYPDQSQLNQQNSHFHHTRDTVSRRWQAAIHQCSYQRERPDGCDVDLGEL